MNMNFENFDQNSVIESSKFARGKTTSEQQFVSCQVEMITSQMLLVTFFVSFNPNLPTGIVKIEAGRSMLLA